MKTYDNTYTAPIKKKKWNNLWYCKEGEKWKKLWANTYGDESTTITQVEYTICCYCWRKLLNEDEIVKVVSAWWKKHHINGNFYHLRHFTIPKTYKFTKPYVKIIEDNYSKRRRIEQTQRRAKRRSEEVAKGVRPERTADQIVQFVRSAGIASAEQIAGSLDVSLAATRRQLARLAKTGLLHRSQRGCYGIQAVTRD